MPFEPFCCDETADMNVYDFDQTIFYPDSSYCFVMYCLRHYPRAVLHAVPAVCLVGAAHLLGKASTRELKEKVFSFLPRLDDVDRIVQEFWMQYEGNMEPWYLKQKREDDLIISASPEFLLRPVAEKLGFALLATPMDPYTGIIRGWNCHDEEKVRRFREAWPDAQVESFYSDSLSDTPMAELAQKAFLVKHGTLIPWPKT